MEGAKKEDQLKSPLPYWNSKRDKEKIDNVWTQWTDRNCVWKQMLIPTKSCSNNIALMAKKCECVFGS